MSRVLVTGGSGFIGRHCLPLLVARGFEVHALSSRSPGLIDVPELDLAPGAAIQWHRADLLHPEAVDGILQALQPTHLLHLAWHVRSGDWPTAGTDENLRFLQASLSLLRAFAANGGQRALLAGSCTEYDWSYGYCSERRTPRNPSSLYGACKSALGDVVEAYSMVAGLSTAWARIFFLYGPHENPVRLVPSITRSLIRGEPALASHGEQMRDYLYVLDVANALVSILESRLSGPINVGSGHPVAIKDIVYGLADRLCRRDLVRLGAIPVMGPEEPLVAAETTRLTHELGWRPAWDLARGLDQTIDWWKRVLNVPPRE